jgi:hypothetical protein
MRARALLPLLVAAALSACGAPRVSVRYPAADTPQARSRALALSNTYLLVTPPKRVPNTLLGKALKRSAKKVRFLGDRIFDLDARALAQAAAEAIEKSGGRLIAYRVTDAKGRMPFAERLSPTSILRVSLDSFSVDRKKIERKVKKRDKETKKYVEVMAVFWKYDARLSGRASLASYPDGKTIASSTFTVRHSGEVRGRGKGDGKRKWVKRAWPILLKKASARMLSGLGPPRIIVRSRTIYVDKEDPASKGAAKLARGGRWIQAAGIWAAGLEDGAPDWRDLMNLALASEREGLYQEAKRVYSDAREAAGDDPEAAGVPWIQIFSDLDAMSALGVGRAEKAKRWFDAPVAVLPFADETTSVDGPEMLREMVWKTLQRGGYAVVDMETSDRLLRSHGFSMGGQLPKGKPANFARWTGAKRVLFGNITEFRDVMLGRFGRRIVAGKLWMWDADSRGRIWKAEEPVVNEAAELKDEKKAEARLSSQIGRAFFERWLGKPLGPESRDFVRVNLETLPLRPPRKR